MSYYFRGKNMDETKTISVMSQPAQIELSTNAKGQHQWSIKLYGEEMNSELLGKVLEIDQELSEKFKNERDIK